eukprot:jgi/Mesvir1/3749/Mv15024-RA.1
MGMPRFDAGSCVVAWPAQGAKALVCSTLLALAKPRHCGLPLRLPKLGRLDTSEWWAHGDGKRLVRRPLATRAMTSPCVDPQHTCRWQSLHLRRGDLCLDLTLPTGQAFRWVQVPRNDAGPGVGVSGEGYAELGGLPGAISTSEYRGVVGPYAVALRQEGYDVLFRCLGSLDDPAGLEPALRNYFNLHVNLPELWSQFSAADEHFSRLAPYTAGARMLRQDPLECLYAFLCSSNNNIARIKGMVGALARYGRRIPIQQPPDVYASTTIPATEQQTRPDGPTALPTSNQPSVSTTVPTVRQPGGARDPPHLSGSVGASDARAAVVVSGARAGMDPCRADELEGDSATKGRAARSMGGPQPGPGALSHAKKGKRGGEEDREEEDGLGGGGAAAGSDLEFFVFPSLKELAAATEEELRALGFGYRAKFIVGTTVLLRSKGTNASMTALNGNADASIIAPHKATDADAAGLAWLHGLRARGPDAYADVIQELMALPGVGPKVAACIALFSLDQHASIPVDTHVWQLAIRHYTPHLEGRSLTPRVHGEVMGAFVQRFGPYAGWAHNALFLAELTSQRERLPPHLRVTVKSPPSKKKAPGAATIDDASTEEQAGAKGKAGPKGKTMNKALGGKKGAEVPAESKVQGSKNAANLSEGLSMKGSKKATAGPAPVAAGNSARSMSKKVATNTPAMDQATANHAATVSKVSLKKVARKGGAGHAAAASSAVKEVGDEMPATVAAPRAVLGRGGQGPGETARKRTMQSGTKSSRRAKRGPEVEVQGEGRDVTATSGAVASSTDSLAGLGLSEGSIPWAVPVTEARSSSSETTVPITVLAATDARTLLTPRGTDANAGTSKDHNVSPPMRHSPSILLGAAHAFENGYAITSHAKSSPAVKVDMDGAVLAGGWVAPVAAPFRPTRTKRRRLALGTAESCL